MPGLTVPLCRLYRHDEFSKSLHRGSQVSNARVAGVQNDASTESSQTLNSAFSFRSWLFSVVGEWNILRARFAQTNSSWFAIQAFKCQLPNGHSNIKMSYIDRVKDSQGFIIICVTLFSNLATQIKYYHTKFWNFEVYDNTKCQFVCRNRISGITCKQ